MVSTEGLSRVSVLQALYVSAKPLGLGLLQYDPVPLIEEDAVRVLRTSSYVDYLRGRVMKVDLGDPIGFDEWLYDSDNGPGAAQRAINALRTHVA